MKRKATESLEAPDKKQKQDEKPLQHPYQLRHLELKDPEYMNEVPIHLQNKDIPGFPTTVLAVGEPGSGKTNCLMNLLTRPDLWQGFFDKIYLLGPTIKSDKLYQKIIVPEDQIVTDDKEFIPKLKEWTEKQVQAVKDNPNEAPKCLFIFEDITSYYSTVQADPDFAKCFNTIRHHKATAYANIHKLKALNRTARMSCRHIMVWPVNRTEVDQLYDDYGPKNLHKKDFYVLCDDAWKPDEFNAKPYLYINKYAPEDKRYRKCWTHIIDVKSYEGKAKQNQKARDEPVKKKERQKRMEERETFKKSSLKRKFEMHETHDNFNEPPQADPYPPTDAFSTSI